MSRYLYTQAAAPVVSLDNVDLTAIGAPTPAAPFTQDEFCLVQAPQDKGQRRVTAQFTLTSNLTSITVELQGSIDGVNWFTLQSSIQTQAGTYELTQANVNQRFVRLAITALTAGAGKLNKGLIYQY